MKKYTIMCLLTAAVGLLGGCNSWLDVKPYDSMTEDQLYSTELGIQKALNGVYLRLASQSLYAKELTCGTVDVLAQRFFVRSTEHEYYEMFSYKYTGDKPKAKLENIWKEAYGLIADCNQFLATVPENKGVLRAVDYPVMMGEALAVRTLLHFDLFRLFGAVYTDADKNRQAIPYYDQVTDVPAAILSGEALMERLMSDIDTAIVWMAKDPVRTDGIGDEDGFWDYRNLRMNYYATLALKARMLWYMGGEYNAEAYAIAAALLEGKDPYTGSVNNFVDIFKVVSSQSAANDRVFYSEVLFGIHNMKRDDLHKGVFSTDLEDKSILWVHGDFYNGLFTQANDYRNRWFEAASSDRGDVKSFLRFTPADGSPDNQYGHETQSVIRLSELLLIAASTTEDADLQRMYLERLRINRGYQTGNATGLDLKELLDEEFQREFHGEGQYFFFLKRNEVKTIKNQEGNSVTVNYIIPLPDSEMNNRYN